MTSNLDAVCSDARCLGRFVCERWLRREARAPGVKHVGTMRKAWQVNHGLCDRAVPTQLMVRRYV